MADKEISIEELKRLIKSDKAVLGTERTLKLLKAGTAEQVFLSSNCPEDIKKDIEYYAKLAGTSLVYLKYPNDEVGILCKKPYPVSVLSINQ
ncbi:MAG: ribosomal L7Ae/L30e/S12e/Gadd45 family protein [Syntrophales bacterium]